MRLSITLLPLAPVLLGRGIVSLLLEGYTCPEQVRFSSGLGFPRLKIQDENKERNSPSSVSIHDSREVLWRLGLGTVPVPESVILAS